MIKDTICAIATPPGIGATAMIRVSGFDAFRIAGLIFSDRFKLDELPPNTAKFASVFDKNDVSDGHGPSLVDQVVVVKFVSPHSFTGEDTVEVSCHGSVYIQRKIIGMLVQNGCRMAEPGEFTQRAFLNGKLDLPQAESIADIIEAQSEGAHAAAIKQLQGRLSNRLALLREELLNIASLLELELDFSEEDVEFADRQQLVDIVDKVRGEVSVLLDGYKNGNMLKHGVPVAIVGNPNVGKSTLMNAILQRDRAIVSAIPGTTRDTVEDFFNINGVLFRFIDTAGIRESDDEIEKIGIQRTFDTVSDAAVVLYVFDSSKPESDFFTGFNSFKSSVETQSKSVIIVANKSDQTDYICENDNASVCVSAKFGHNINALTDMIYHTVIENGILGDKALVVNERHYSHLNRIMRSAEDLRKGIDSGIPADILAEDVRLMLHDIGEITGTVSSDDILNNIFGKFCIGK